MTANIRTSIEQKINKIIPNFSTSNLHTIASTRIFEGETKSRFSLFYEAIGISLEEQKRINNLATKPKKKEYIDLITKFVEGNSVDKFKSGDRKGENKMDNIGRQKLFDVMKLYIVKNPESFELSESKTTEKEPEEKVQDNKQRNQKLKSEIENLFQRSKTPQAMDSMKLFGLAESKQPVVEPQINLSEGMASKYLGVTESKQATTPQTPNSKIAIQNKNQPAINTRLAEIKSPVYVPRMNTFQTIANTPVRTEPVENKKITLSDLLDAESENLVPKKIITKPTMTGVRKRQQARKEKNNLFEKKQTTAEFLKQNEDEFTQASLADEKEREVKLPEQEQTMLTGISKRLSNLNYGALIGMAASYAVLNNNKGMLQYLPILGATMGSHLYDTVTSSGFTNLMNTLRKFGADPKDIIKDPRIPSSKKATRAVKFEPKKEDEPEPEPEQEGKHDGPPRNKPPVKDDIPSPIDSKFENLDKPSIPPKMSLRESVNQVAGTVSRLPGKIVDNIISAVATPFLDALEIKDTIEYDIYGRPTRYDEQGEKINPLLYRGEYLDGKAVAYDREGNMVDYATGKRIVQSNILRDVNGVILEPFDDRTPAGPFAERFDLDDDEFSDPPSITSPPIRTPITDRFRDTIDRAERFARSSDIRNKVSAGVAAAAVGVGLSNMESDIILKNQQTKSGGIKEDPIAYKQDTTDQNDVPTPPGLIRGAGILKPKFIVPSVNIFAKTEQESFVDDMEFAMFDFVQDDSGGNDPDGTNPILRDQTISKGLRYQRSGVTVNSLYGRDIPNDPKNISKELMNQLFLGESVLPQMKFLFSEEFYPQEFNLSEFEVNNYDVNNELTAIEMLSPYANFTNNQLLDQFIDTSILYGVVP